MLDMRAGCAHTAKQNNRVCLSCIAPLHLVLRPAQRRTGWTVTADGTSARTPGVPLVSSWPWPKENGLTTATSTLTRRTVHWGHLITLVVVVFPFLALLYAIHQLWNREVNTRDLAIC